MIVQLWTCAECFAVEIMTGETPGCDYPPPDWIVGLRHFDEEIELCCGCGEALQLRMCDACSCVFDPADECETCFESVGAEVCCCAHHGKRA